MTPEERNLIAELFDRLATLEDAERDPDAERAIKDGLRQAPNAAYALVQTVLVQDEALKRADARIRELESEPGPGAEPQQRPAGFLDNMRNAVFGRPEAPRSGSVPSVRSPETPWGAPGGSRAGMQPGPGVPPEPMRPGGSFLGTAAAAAAGMIGGSLLLDGIRSMTGGAGHRPSSFGGADSASAGHQASSPWSNSAGSDLSRQAGLDDIGRSPAGSGGESSGGRSHGLFDTTQNEADDTDDAGYVDDDFDSGDGGFDLGGGDDSP
jgi:uncharacterized protein